MFFDKWRELVEFSYYVYNLKRVVLIMKVTYHIIMLTINI